MAQHGIYHDVSGWFVVPPSSSREAHIGGQDTAATTLCKLGAAQGIDCAVMTQAGNHDWAFAAGAFAAALPWLAGQLRTAGAPRTGFPGEPPALAANP
jgi:S-formylglutathione hydrolase FrmB